ncbi:MAG: hypothetical protein SXV54_02925 [Chloroflexota bacterium]|nr:hypothetical protein [Chloroflexota bacterium]
MIERLFGGQARKRKQRDERLSAYLDGEMSAGEWAHLEAQLVTDPALQAELDALRRTVELVRDLPSISVPRNFILPQTTQARPQPARQVRLHRVWTTPFLTAATTVVSLLFVAVLAGDLLLSGAGGMASAPPVEMMLEVEAPPQAQQAPSSADEEIAAEVTVQVETEEVLGLETMPMEVPAEAMPKATGEAEDYVSTPAGRDATAPAAGSGGPTEEPPAPMLVPTPASSNETPMAPPTEMPKANGGSTEPTPSEEATVAPQMLEEEGWRATEVGPESRESEPELDSRLGISPWRVLEVILGLTALGLALATFWAWHTRRR